MSYMKGNVPNSLFLDSVTTEEILNAEKTYYSKILQEKEQNIKATWKILNDLTKRKNTNNGLPREFQHGNETLNNPIDIANGFNHYFANVGPELAKKNRAA